MIYSLILLLLAGLGAVDVDKPDFIIAYAGDIQGNLVECG